MKQQLNEIKRMQQLAGIISESDMPRASFQKKFVDIENPQEFVEKFHVQANNPLTKIVSRYIGDSSNFAITNENGEFNVYKFRQVSEPGKSVGTFKSIEDAKNAVQNMDRR